MADMEVDPPAEDVKPKINKAEGGKASGKPRFEVKKVNHWVLYDLLMTFADMIPSVERGIAVGVG